jgi:hypothetical protein
MNDTVFYKKLQSLPDQSCFIWFKDRRYLLTKSTLCNGKLIKLYAKELGGNDIVSGNYYVSIKNGLLKPCEMSPQKVIDFILKLKEEQ